MDDREIAIRLLLAVFIGGIIGFERESRRRAAGLRTNILVCVGATLITMTSIFISKTYGGIYHTSDPARVASGIVMGIGFLGAGTIMRYRTSVLGLTTAASLWGVAGVGLALGCGFYKAALFAAAVIFLTLVALGKFTRRYMGKGGSRADIDIDEDA